MPTASESDGGDDAAVQGTAVISEGCPLLDIEGEGIAAVEFPEGTDLLDDGVTLSLADGRTLSFKPGDLMSFAGGIGDAARGLDVGSDDLATCIERTGATAVVFVSGEGD